jgi:hypothetical protein
LFFVCRFIIIFARKLKHKIMVKKKSLTPTFNPISKVIAVLKWAGHITDKLKKAKTILQKMTGNAYFPTPWPANIVTLAKLNTDITTLDTAITAAAGKGKGTAAVENAAAKVVHDDLTNIKNMVQITMDANPANAVAIAESGGYDCKAETTHGKRQTKAKKGPIPGCVLLEGAGEGMHQWMQSPDGGKTIIHLDPTTGGKKTVVGLTSDVRMYFRSRLVLPKEQYGEWSDWVSIMVP